MTKRRRNRGQKKKPSIVYYKGTDLRNRLNLGHATGAFGIAYSILTLGGLFKGFSLYPGAIAKTIGKGIEDGHAMAFMLDLAGDELTTTGMGSTGWVFNSGTLRTMPWARQTTNATTYLYYTTGDDLAQRFAAVRDELEDQPAGYGLLTPNLPGRDRRENCISSTHYIVYRMGMGYWVSTKGLWVPSFSNTMTWMATKFSAWKYLRVDSANTHLPDWRG
ncbi:MAG: hypothetical protein OHK0024_27310 [Thalassobaculales bacterium]